MNKKVIYKILHFCCTALAFWTLYYLSLVIFQRLYVFEWTAVNNYLYLWAVAFILILFNRTAISYCITFGNIAGILVGQFLGDALQAANMSKITETSTVEEIHHLSLHYGVFIWLSVVLLFVVSGVLVIKMKKKAGQNISVL